MFSGVLRAVRIVPFMANPTPNNTRLTARKVIRAVEMDVFIFPCCLAPRYWDVSTEAPFPPPMAIMMNTLVRA